ncbi:hypothetical protein [Spiroplasma turonicum]|nr:hypothetical protein [Spiroplasma turonicum]ALX70503.1 cell division protein FtsA [Spiroplasma turonicum]
MFKEVYAVFEVTKTELKFAVGVFRDNTGLKVICKERIKGKWLTDEDEIIDVFRVSTRLKKFVSNYNVSFNSKLQRICIVFPSNTLLIKDAVANILLNKTENIVTVNHINNLYEQARRINFDDRNIVINLKPYLFSINNHIKSAIPPINATNVNSVSMNAKVYTINKKVYNSFLSVLEHAGLEKLTLSFDVYTIARQINDDRTFKDNFITINWGYNNIDISYFCKETLIKKESINFGIENIIQNLATKINSKFEVANKYIFKLLDFSSKDKEDSVIYRKYIASEKKLYELKPSDLKTYVTEEINYVIDKVDNYISKELQFLKSARIIHVGKMTEIAGFEKILQRSKYKVISSIYYSLVTGASEIWLTSMCGMIKLSRINNKNSSEIITSNGRFKKQILFNDYNFPKVNHNVVNPQLNGHNRVIVDPRIINNNQRVMINKNSHLLNQRMQYNQQKSFQNNNNYVPNANKLVQNNHSWESINNFNSNYQNGNGPISEEYTYEKQKNR